MEFSFRWHAASSPGLLGIAFEDDRVDIHCAVHDTDDLRLLCSDTEVDAVAAEYVHA